MCSHAPTKGEQMVCYYSHYINVVRGNEKRLTLTIRSLASWNRN
jgi:hypothetical protein